MTAIDELAVKLAPRIFPTSSREKMASKGTAMPDGSYPIPDKDALRRAIQSFGRAKPEKKAAVKAHIIRRAKALGAYDMIPDDWKKAAASTPMPNLERVLVAFSR